MTPESTVLMAAYNASMNQKMYAAAARLPHADLTADRNAFFGSILGTMNHLLAADTIWLSRFATHPARYSALAPMLDLPAPSSLTHSFGDYLPSLLAHRHRLDAIVTEWAPQVSAEHLAQTMEYRSTRGDLYRKHFGSLVLHFFNHQTHHRGQVSTLLTQAGVDIGVTDLLAMVPDIEAP
ncbi:DinB family protein [Duganella sp. BJB1802]|uniref:DinB family protein n=1 Tax=Duganella sp. BJB1802 TaxID=2744575 RepID=UPI001E33D382|nr:DinB family protein [Duganella sp. BJB1802]